MVNICIIGASTLWIPGIVTDLMSVFDEPLEIRLVDINPDAAKICTQWCEVANKHHGRNDRFIPFTDRRAALAGADAVIITIATGGLDAMENDIVIPEKYGIYATVGDTAGPGGWSCAIRNIPVFMEFAEDFQTICPRAFIANYVNPMSAITATLSHCCDNAVVGLCHAYFETKDIIQTIFGLDDWSKISISIAGMNHFHWVVGFKIGKDDGYELLRKRIGNGSIRDLMPAFSGDEIGFISGHELCAEFYDMFGHLVYPGDRHNCEFVSFTLSGRNGHPQRFQKDGVETVSYYNLHRTSIKLRRDSHEKRNKRIRDWIDGKAEMPTKSRETSAEMIHAYVTNKPLVDAVNTLNVGQIQGLPYGCCVETLGVIDGLGVRPLAVENIPDQILEIMRPQAVCQKWVTQGCMQHNKDLLLQALYHDPQCAHLKPPEIRMMAGDLLDANKQFFSL